MDPEFIVVRAATQAFFDANEIVRLIDILRAGNNPDVFPEINRRKAGPTAITIQLSLFTRLHMVVCRHYTPTRKGDFSARAAFEHLEDQDVYKKVVDVGADKKLLDDVRLMWSVYSQDPNIAAYIHLRNKFVAHLSDENPDIPKPLVREIFGIGETSARLFDQLARAVHATTTDFEFERTEQRKSAEAFWGIWKC
jgi:hypothetical protein